MMETTNLYGEVLLGCESQIVQPATPEADKHGTAGFEKVNVSLNDHPSPLA